MSALNLKISEFRNITTIYYCQKTRKFHKNSSKHSNFGVKICSRLF